MGARIRLSFLSLSLLGLVTSGFFGCSDTDVCLSLDTECEPLYEPTFENVYQNTLEPRCGVPGAACHAREGAASGLVLADIDESYQRLTEPAAGQPLVELDNLGCGVLLQRVGSESPAFQMPPSAPLPPAELCAIRQWVALGAQR